MMRGIGRIGLQALASTFMLATLVLAPSALADSAASTPVAPTLTLTVSSPAVTFGGAAVLTARLGIGGATVQLSRMAAGATGFAPIAALLTDATGAVGYRALPRATTTYRVEFAGNDSWLPATAEVTVPVRPQLRFWAAAAVYRGARAGLSVQVLPAHPGGTVSVEVWQDGGWVQWRALKLDEQSSAATLWKADAVGRQSFRVSMTADAEHAAGASGVRHILVQPPSPYRVPIDAPRIVVVDISQYRLHFYSLGREVRSFACVTGRPSLPTPLGHFKIYAKGMNPGGPYGARIMSYHPPCAIHGTDEPGLLKRFPRNFSHGCTRLANANAIWLYDHAPMGTPVWNVP